MDQSQKYNLLSSRVKSLDAELGVIETINKEALMQFQKRISDLTPHKEDYKKTDSNQKEHPSSNTNQDVLSDIIDINRKPIDPEYKKLFKEIAKFTHPDKLKNKSNFEKKIKLDLFDKAKDALENDDLLSLRDIAESLNIALNQPTRKDVESLKNKIQKSEKKISDIKNSFPWVWYHEEDTFKKNNIINIFLSRLNKANLDIDN